MNEKNASQKLIFCVLYWFPLFLPLFLFTIIIYNKFWPSLLRMLFALLFLLFLFYIHFLCIFFAFSIGSYRIIIFFNNGIVVLFNANWSINDVSEILLKFILKYIEPNFTFHSSKELHHYKLDNKLSFFFLTLPPTIVCWKKLIKHFFTLVKAKLF